MQTATIEGNRVIRDYDRAITLYSDVRKGGLLLASDEEETTYSRFCNIVNKMNRKASEEGSTFEIVTQEFDVIELRNNKDGVSLVVWFEQTK